MGLDDKTLLRKSEDALEKRALKLLERMGIKAQNVSMALGMEQEFFVIPKAAYLKRIDIRQCGRALVNDVPPRNQQFSDHYYGKLPAIVEDILSEVERELFELGVPVKTRHKEVALNQFEFCPLFEDVCKAIDHNMIMMEILREAFDRHGYVALFHEKPFAHQNGSGKHCNWSLNYIDEKGKPINIFKVPKSGSEKQKNLFKMFVLLNLNAIVNNGKLYMSSISTHANELRLGGHEAPPRIISSFLGDAVTQILDDKSFNEIQNLKEKVNTRFDVFQEDTDRNRTSPYAFAGNKFEFRAVGSSQNTSFPMAVIAATIAREIDFVLEKLDKGDSIEKVIADLTESSRPARFEGNGYSPEWVEEARKRGLYVNTEISESIDNLRDHANVFCEIGAADKEVIKAKHNNSSALYIGTVALEERTMQVILSREFIPRAYTYAQTLSGANSEGVVGERSERFRAVFAEVVELENQLNANVKSQDGLEIGAACKRRGWLNNVLIPKVNELIHFLPKSDTWPDLEDFMNQY
jgi:glutamine synthetase